LFFPRASPGPSSISRGGSRNRRRSGRLGRGLGTPRSRRRRRPTPPEYHRCTASVGLTRRYQRPHPHHSARTHCSGATGPVVTPFFLVEIALWGSSASEARNAWRLLGGGRPATFPASASLLHYGMTPLWPEIRPRPARKGYRSFSCSETTRTPSSRPRMHPRRRHSHHVSISFAVVATRCPRDGPAAGGTWTALAQRSQSGPPGDVSWALASVPMRNPDRQAGETSPAGWGVQITVIAHLPIGTSRQRAHQKSVASVEIVRVIHFARRTESRCAKTAPISDPAFVFATIHVARTRFGSRYRTSLARYGGKSIRSLGPRHRGKVLIPDARVPGGAAILEESEYPRL